MVLYQYKCPCLVCSLTHSITEPPPSPPPPPLFFVCVCVLLNISSTEAVVDGGAITIVNLAGFGNAAVDNLVGFGSAASNFLTAKQC